MMRAQDPPTISESEITKTIEADPAASDSRIEERLREIFRAVDGLADVEVVVTSGVVSLNGEVENEGDVETAGALARRMEGVVHVRNRVSKAVDIDSRLAPALKKTTELWDETIRRLPLILLALASILLFSFLGAWLSKKQHWWKKFGLADLATALVGRVIRLVFVGLGIIIALELLDATAIAGALLGVAGVVGIALGFAFRNIVENYLAGVLLSMRNPFASGDAVKVGEFTGKVIRLTSRDTVLMTLEGNHLRIPNRKVMDSELVNYTRNPRRRFDFSVGISVEQDLVAVRELGLETLGSIPAVLHDPAPSAIIEELGDSTVNLRLLAWIDQTESDFLRVRSEAIRLVKERFDDADIEMPEPIYRIHMMENSSVGPNKGPKRKVTESPMETRADDTIDKQIAMVEMSSEEENLLK
ncbi:mechanosensitive ion channel family protein [Haloferula rosea]|uniref:Mechanosensitive ion channel n=1 Tax=Haloferula rosea TaxID=490093 RepID=A0A934VE64_9BACT|nr:mechanosensitive ion channel family protein [Haloferula rosea]MBK1825647.1 mechanosensitive ion channel [Haloferula rosea]